MTGPARGARLIQASHDSSMLKRLRKFSERITLTVVDAADYRNLAVAVKLFRVGNITVALKVSRSEQKEKKQ